MVKIKKSAPVQRAKSVKRHSSNTARNSKAAPRGKPFTKGDKRINRKGRPRSFDALRELARGIACEIPEDPSNVNAWSRVEMIMRSWATSKDPRLQQSFIEVAYGKVPIEANAKVSGSVQHLILDVKYDDEPTGDQSADNPSTPTTPAPA